MGGFVRVAAIVSVMILGTFRNIVVHAIQRPGVPELHLDSSVEGHIENQKFGNSTISEGVPSQALERIVNGQSADRQEYTYFCRNIVRTSFNRLRYNCGCSYIADGWVLTAAHCVTNPETGELLDSGYGATLGYFCGSPDNCCDPRISECPNFETIPGTYIVHPNYSVRSGLFDFALLKLTRMPQREFEKILPDDGFLTDSLQINSEVTAIGAGQIDNEGLPVGGVLQELDMLYFPVNDCSRSYGLNFGRAAVCAYVAEGLGGVCFGDSGGPLLVRQVTLQSGEQRDVQIGVHSFISGTCEKKQRPDVMASVAGGMPFIRENVCSSNGGEMTRPYWCDGSVEAGPTQGQQPAPRENEDEDEPDGDVPLGCNENRKKDRYLFNPILKRTKPCKHLSRQGLEQIFCASPLTDAKQVCCETCAGITRQSS